VKVASTALIKPSEMRHANASFTLH
jgi:hypothetical protein